ncbi:hypothetical protein IIC65_01185 [Candidatus Sumerlaeota bacterium]|nr:hypothetical protein [Candidatus Sumerlaeota bacterium]
MKETGKPHDTFGMKLSPDSASQLLDLVYRHQFLFVSTKIDELLKSPSVGFRHITH